MVYPAAAVCPPAVLPTHGTLQYVGDQHTLADCCSTASLLRAVEDLVGGVGFAEEGDLGRVMPLEATIFSISAVPEEVNAEALVKPAACSWEGEMKWVLRRAR